MYPEIANINLYKPVASVITQSLKYYSIAIKFTLAIVPKRIKFFHGITSN